MICPYRKQTETVDGTTSEYYMECYKTECPFYIPMGVVGIKAVCKRADKDAENE